MKDSKPVSPAMLAAFKYAAQQKPKGEPDQCWVWSPLTVRDNHYPRFNYNGKYARVHRLSCLAFNGSEPTPEKPYVLHSCDNKWCWNPTHLRHGSAKENNQDAIARGRFAPSQLRGGSGWFHADRQPSPEQYARGERIHLAKLTEAAVREIRSLHAAGATQKALSQQYDVTPNTISGVVRRVTWKHVN